MKVETEDPFKKFPKRPYDQIHIGPVHIAGGWNIMFILGVCCACERVRESGSEREEKGEREGDRQTDRQRERVLQCCSCIGLCSLVIDCSSKMISPCFSRERRGLLVSAGSLCMFLLFLFLFPFLFFVDSSLHLDIVRLSICASCPFSSSFSFFLAGVVFAVVLSGAYLIPPHIAIGDVDFHISGWVRCVVHALLAVGAYYTTPKQVHEANNFSFVPILELAWIFSSIFMTMCPVLVILSITPFPINTPSEFFWTTGALSSILDNSPTFITLFAAARAACHTSTVKLFLSACQHGVVTLTAITLGAVFFGALTYVD